MAETSIAKAYVQIIPSAEGIKGKLSSILGSEATSAGKSAGQSSGNALVSGLKSAMSSASKVVGTAFKVAAKAGVVGLGAAATGIAAFSKQALDAYADYEQLVGGVETLFGDAAGTVMQYADQAFQSAGLSANDYMETVTSFSASLLQSLNNDTGKAAEYANQALVDMSDNANKMGTDMRDIQNAYQGFAKQNYTMLDNLKLGYGGTKEEMERLIEDANKLKKANGETANLSIKSFADIVEAIHLVQTEMGITGTTAKEASTTIQGSVGAMKAAWTNLMVGVADDTQDFDKLVDNFVTSTATAASNILPRLETILAGTGQLITKLAPVIEAAMPVLVQSVLPAVIDAGISLISAFAGAIVSSGPALIQTAMDAIRTVLTNALGLSATTADGIMGVIQSLLDGCNTIFTGIGDAFDTICSTIDTIMADAGITWTDVWSGIAAGISAAAAVISGVITGIADAIAWVVEEARTDGTVLNDVWTGIRSAVSAVGDIVGNVFDDVQSVISGAVATVSEDVTTAGITWDGIWSGICTVVGTAGTAISSALGVLGDFMSWLTSGSAGAEAFQAAIIGIVTAITAYNAIMGVQQAITTVVTAAQTALNLVMAANPIMLVVMAVAALVAGLVYLWNTNEGFREAVTTAWEAIKEAFSAAIDAICGFFSDFAASAGEVWDSIKTTISDTLNAISTTVSVVWSGITSTVSAAVNTVSTTVSNVFNTVKTTVSNIWDGIKTTISNVVNSIKTTVSNVFNAVKTAISTPLTAAQNTVSNIFGSIKTAISDKINAAKDAVHSAIEAIKSKFNFSWSLPKLKLPHISISGKFSISPPSVPTFGISWYAKAMHYPMLLRTATIFGMDSNGTALAGGESGNEVVSGANTLMSMIRGAVGGELADGIASLEDKLDRLIAILAHLTGVTINVNGADYQSKMALAEELMDLIQRDWTRREAAL